MGEYSEQTPINIITGFLGSGKTTLLKGLLAAPDLSDTAVLINEFGAVGLDHELVQNVTESTLLLDNGCVCCAIRGDLQGALRDLLSQRQSGAVPYFRRVVIETSGLADPAPIAYTLLAEPVLQHHFRLGGIITTVDAVNGASQLQRFPESVKQAAMADRLIVTKTDLATPEERDALQTSLRGLNKSAPIMEVGEGQSQPPTLLTDDMYDEGGRQREIEHWLDAAPGDDALVHDHADHIHSFALTYDVPLDWTAFGIWMTMLLHRHGDNVLRIKGLLNVSGVPTPVLINGVQHIVHPPSHLPAWPNENRQSRIIFIVRDMPQAQIERSLAAFNKLANPVAAPGQAA
ncbi:MAG: GTP-binding protein [Rhodospirillaceae bacterium]|nr:GTP-binding protein [Rhodospirillaceae bacterium]MBT5194553.1 GTP-binding protein [Rhodospirillaceae bacterium]MBT5898898.1 GTP-binding protein [Rhodospirillaceae bacterium]MBT6430059.1 GTP-binding protein [Rhodospirillaceae bacterium]